MLGLAAPRLLLAGTEPDGALLRLAWRDGGEPVEVCRTLSEEERASLPAHMQRLEQCQRRYLDHELRVLVDGAFALQQRVAAGGARRDRPGRVFVEVPLAAGARDVVVEYGVVSGEAQAAVPLRLEQRLRAEQGRIYEVGYDAGSARLVIRP